MAVYYFYDESEQVPFRYLSPTRHVGQLPLPYQTTMSPSAYVEFAVEDLATDKHQGLINAFAHVKRAIHLLIDALLNQYGLFAHSRSSNFPTKLQVLDDIGLLPIGIMTNLNIERNLLEHEYVTPTRQRVTEAVDVAKLLLMATERLLEYTPHEVLVGWRVPKRHLLLRVEPQKGEIGLYAIRAPKHYERMNGVSCIVGGIRQFTGDKLNPWVQVATRPWRTIVLDKGHRNEWVPIIKELVSVQRRFVLRKTFVAHEAGEVTIPVTIPVSLPHGVSWNALLDRHIGKAMETRPSEESGSRRRAKGRGPRIVRASGNVPPKPMAAGKRKRDPARER